MTPRQALLAALARDPSDELAWLALADRLEEEGDGGAAEVLRLHRQIRKSRDGPARREVEVRLHALLAAGARPVVPETVNSVGMRLVLVPPGKFRRGSPPGEDRRMEDEPLRTVTLTQPFWLGVFAVTQDQYAAVTRRRPSHFKRATVKDASVPVGSLPVESVSWEGAAAFCARLSARAEEQAAGRVYRLPTEAEWEYACRAWGSSRFPFHFGDRLEAGMANFDTRHPFPADDDAPLDIPSLGRTSRVGSYAPNAFGLYDMHGNVDEWCADWFDGSYYEDGLTVDPLGPVAGYGRVIRGGSWRGQGEDCRAAVRIGYSPDDGFWHVGFRVACDHVPA